MAYGRCKDSGVAPESENNLRLEIGHVLFIDLVGYSKLLIEEQKEHLGQLTNIVLATSQVAQRSQLVVRSRSHKPSRLIRRSQCGWVFIAGR